MAGGSFGLGCPATRTGSRARLRQRGSPRRVAWHANWPKYGPPAPTFPALLPCRRSSRGRTCVLRWSPLPAMALRPPAHLLTSSCRAPNYLASAPSQSGLMILGPPWPARLVYARRKCTVQLQCPVLPGPSRAHLVAGKPPFMTTARAQMRSPYTSYTTRHTIRAGHGLTADLHELVLTSRGTALITCYQTGNANLSSAGGSTKGQVVGGHVQEIDITSGKVLFDWNSLGPIACIQKATSRRRNRDRTTISTSIRRI